jgi:RimJ/RimL family protein N-acetyltransferase
MPHAGAIEIAWRLDRPFWGRGYAPEAADAALRDLFERLVPEEVIAYAAALNGPSRRVMGKLGMLEDKDAAFDHPALAQGDRLRRHVVYRIARADFLARTDRR